MSNLHQSPSLISTFIIALFLSFLQMIITSVNSSFPVATALPINQSLPRSQPHSQSLDIVLENEHICLPPQNTIEFFDRLDSKSLVIECSHISGLKRKVLVDVKSPYPQAKLPHILLHIVTFDSTSTRR